MPTPLLNVKLTDHAWFAYSTLGAEDQRLLDGWFAHLRNWNEDDYIRARSRHLGGEEDLYAFETSAGLVIAFSVSDKEVTIRAIFRTEALKAFRPSLAATGS